MVKHAFIYLAVVVVLGVAVWFFVQKARNASNDSDLAQLVSSEEPEPATLEETSDTSDENSGWMKLPNGLEVKDVTIGFGREAKEGDVVSTHYTGTLENGTKFDSSYDRGQPFSFILGGGMVIKGWDIGVVGMKVGGKRKLIIPPDLAYGNREVGGVIPANSILLFDIELVAVETPKQ